MMYNVFQLHEKFIVKVGFLPGWFGRWNLSVDSTIADPFHPKGIGLGSRRDLNPLDGTQLESGPKMIWNSEILRATACFISDSSSMFPENLGFSVEFLVIFAGLTFG